MNDLVLQWKQCGARVGSVVVLSATDGKYSLTSNKFDFDLFLKGTGPKIPAPSSKSSSDEYMSVESTAAETIRMKISPKTKTLANGVLTEESGTSTDKTYPEITMVAGNTPLKASARISPTELNKAQQSWHKVPCLVALHTGKSVAGSATDSFCFVMGKLTSEITDQAADGKSQDGITMTFTAESVSLDATVTFTAINSALTDITPFGSSTAVAFTELTAEDVALLAAGELVFKG